jgi:hypothetical protein
MEQQQPQEADDVAAPSSSLLDAACLLGAALSDGASLTVSTALAVSRCARVRARLAAQLSPDSLAGVLVNVEEAAMHMHGIKRAALTPPAMAVAPPARAATVAVAAVVRFATTAVVSAASGTQPLRRMIPPPSPRRTAC